MTINSATKQNLEKCIKRTREFRELHTSIDSIVCVVSFKNANGTKANIFDLRRAGSEGIVCK
jgi:hypothetical protein